MPETHLSSKNVTPASPACTTCGKKMVLTSVTPTSGGIIYGFLCEKDGDRLNWQPGHSNSPSIARDVE